MFMEKVAEAWATEMRRGHTKLAILALLSKSALSGYDIMKEIEEKTLGIWKITSGGVYPILSELQEKNYIIVQNKEKSGRKRKIYGITDEGKQLLKSAFKKQQQIAKTMDTLIRSYVRDILDTEPPKNLVPFPLDFFSIMKYLNGKPVEEQISILKKFRDHMIMLIKRVDERLKKMEVTKEDITIK